MERRPLTPENDELNDTGSTLQDGGKSPRPVVTPVVSTEAGPRDQKRAQIPQTIIHGGETGAVLRMADLGQEHGRADLSKGVAESKENTTTSVDTIVGSGSLKSGTNSHKDETESNRGATTPAIGNNRDKGNGANRADLVKCDEKAETTASGRAEEVIPAVKVLDDTHVHADCLLAL